MLFFLTDLTSGKIDPQATVRQKTQVKKEWRLKMICLMSITLRIKKDMFSALNLHWLIIVLPVKKKCRYNKF